MADELFPLDLVGRALRDWKLVILMIIVGGLAAWLVFLSQPPLYESQASISFAFNVVRTGKMSAAEEDAVMGAAGFMIANAPLGEVSQAASQRGILLGPAPLNQSVFVERRSYRWVVRVRQADPQAAAFLANTWIQSAYQQLLAALPHAEQAELLRLYQVGLVSCLQRSSAAAPAPADCPIGSLAQLQAEIQAAGAAIQSEKIAAAGLLPYLIIAPPDQAVPAGQPGQFGRAGTLLAGVLIGFLLAVLSIFADLPAYLAKRMRRHAASNAHAPP